MAVLRVVCAAVLAVSGVHGHGQMNYPPSTRQGLPGKTWPGALAGQGAGGYCEQPDSMSGNPGKGGVPKRGGNPLNGACMLFSQPGAHNPKISTIPGEPTLNDKKYRTNNVNVSSGHGDWTRTMPWRAPGESPVLGRGCGVAGGGIDYNSNGGWPPTGMTQGQDPLDVTKPPSAGPATMWQRGSNQTVAMVMIRAITPAALFWPYALASFRPFWLSTLTSPSPQRPINITADPVQGIWANHGGGYSYRLCKNVLGKVSEQCFQQTPLKFAEDDIQWLQHVNGTKYQIEMTKFTSPAGSQWARIPFPTCATGGSQGGGHGFTDGTKGPDGVYYCKGGTEYPEPLLNGQRIGLVGFGYCNNTQPTFSSDDASPAPESRSCTADKYHAFSVVDRVTIPADLEEGDYFISWRWDCEQVSPPRLPTVVGAHTTAPYCKVPPCLLCAVMTCWYLPALGVSVCGS